MTSGKMMLSINPMEQVHINFLLFLLCLLAALSASEHAAIRYADLLTRDVHGVSDAEFQKLTKADYDALVKEFQPQGALEVLLQCGNFAYMNRFTDGLSLPSEDEAIKIYHETYGKSFEEVRKARN